MILGDQEPNHAVAVRSPQSLPAAERHSPTGTASVRTPQSLSATRVVIADRQPLVLQGLAHVVRACASASIEHCTSPRELTAALLGGRADLAIVDAGLDEPDGLRVLRDARHKGSNIPSIFMTGNGRDSEVLETVSLGIQGLLSKDSPVESVAQCVKVVLAGGTYRDHELVNRAVATVFKRESVLRELAQSLTAREVQVVLLIATGGRTRELAERLCVSEGTLKGHLHHIYEKLGVSGRAQLMAYARQRGLA
jgi:DNA-binding NarL/FixJ family response regulator